MPTVLDWTRFKDLFDAPHRAFESLCRAIVQRNYGKCGPIRARRNQPGVEFFLPITRDCSLGGIDRVYGWSCKWFELPSSHKLSSSKRKQIVDSLDKAIRYVDGLTDFVLCLPELPAQADLDWYQQLQDSDGVTLHLWADEALEAGMTGDAEVLRRTYFGELVATPEALANAHNRSIAPIRKRWTPDLHVATDADRGIGLALARPGSMDNLKDYGNTIGNLVGLLLGEIDTLPASIRSLLYTFAEDMTGFAAYLAEISESSNGKRPIEAIELVLERRSPLTSERQIQRLARTCRRHRTPLSLVVESFCAEIHHALDAIDNVRKSASSPLIAIVGSAGIGKTQLAAQLTAPSADWIAGVFLQGGDLRSGNSLDDLASRVPGLRASNFEDLLELTDSAGARAGCRVPVIIDGLNEAERPSEWRRLLDQVIPVLDSYSNLLLVVTLRDSAHHHLLPEAADTWEIIWQDHEVQNIVSRYFEHYKIDPGASLLPSVLFRSPLFLRIYCETANPERQIVVGVEGLPNSLIGVFELYRQRIAERLSNDPVRPSLPPGHVEQRLALLAQSLWDQGLRRLPYSEVKDLIDDPEMDWDVSLYRRLEEEGVVYRHGHSGTLNAETGFLFDRFAGYLIGDYILDDTTSSGVEATLASPVLWNWLAGVDSRPLGADVLVALVELLPRRLPGLHLWTLAPEEHRMTALVPTLELESDLLDASTVDELAKYVADCDTPRYGYHPFDRLWEVYDAPSHRLNARFLDRVLLSMPMPRRDYTWTQWVSRRAEFLVEELDTLVARWESTDVRTERDDLIALAVAWMLPSTSLDIRDLATKALQRYGRSAPERIFALATRMICVNDPYVEERMVAAAFGTATFHQQTADQSPFVRAFGEWLVVLKQRYLVNAPDLTTNELIRTYVRASFEIAEQLHPAALPADMIDAPLQFTAQAPPESIDKHDERADECKRAFRMDFENYVVGSIVRGRSNYDYEHDEFQEALAQVYGRVWDLGWRDSLLGEIDRSIENDQWRRGDGAGRVERYGKKYSWIAYHELVGRLDDSGMLGGSHLGGQRYTVGDIDPTFPAEPDPAPFDLPDWAAELPADDSVWIRSHEVAVPDDLWAPSLIDSHDGPWILAEGFLEHGRGGRQVFGFFRTLIVAADMHGTVVDRIQDRTYLGNHYLPPCPSHYGIFAGEMPWSMRFEVDTDDEDVLPGYALLQEDWNDPGISIELVATEYSFEGVRTSTNLDRDYCVPSHGLARKLKLLQRPGSLDLVARDGEPASLTFRATDPWKGQLLYLRQDLLRHYAGDREIVLVAWGERMVDVDWHAPPEWLREVHDNGEHRWREVRGLA